jgi:hypothetical protein
VAHPKPVKAVLEFRVPARNSTTQDIPIINNTDRDWPIKVTLTSSDGLKGVGALFSCPNNFAKEVKNIPFFSIFAKYKFKYFKIIIRKLFLNKMFVL